MGTSATSIAASSVPQRKEYTKKKQSNWKVLWRCCSSRIDYETSLCGEEVGKKHGRKNDAGNTMDISKTDTYLAPDLAAIRIQTAFRGFLARRVLSALRSLMRFQEAVSNSNNKNRMRQSNDSLARSMQAFVRMQARIHAHRALKSRGQPIQLPKSLCYTMEPRTSDAEGWCDSIGTMEEIEAKAQRRQEAMIKRERAMAYALLNQWRMNAKVDGRSLLHCELGNSTWSWMWLDHWISGSSPGLLDANHHLATKDEENNVKRGTTLEAQSSCTKNKKSLIQAK